MRFFHSISPALRSGLMVAAGTALIALPLVLGLSAAAAITGLVVGIIAVALGLAGSADEGRGTLPLSAQAVYDRGLGFGLVAAAALFALEGEPAASAFFGCAGLIALLLTGATRYSARSA